MSKILIVILVLSAMCSYGQEMFDRRARPLPDSSWSLADGRVVVRRLVGTGFTLPPTYFYKYDTVENTGGDLLLNTGVSAWGPFVRLKNCSVSFLVWSDHPVHNAYDSGAVELKGDPVQIIRQLAKRSDSLEKRLDRMRDLADRVINAFIGLQKKEMSAAAVGERIRVFYNYAYVIPRSKPEKAKVRRRDSL